MWQEKQRKENTEKIAKLQEANTQCEVDLALENAIRRG